MAANNNVADGSQRNGPQNVDEAIEQKARAFKFVKYLNAQCERQDAIGVHVYVGLFLFEEIHAMVETLRRMYRYQDWAMEQLWPVLEGLTPEELDSPGCSGNGTIRGTLTHLIRVQNGWFTWFDGTKSAADAQSMRRKDADFATMADAREEWREASDRAEACVAKLSDADVAKAWTAERPGGMTLSQPLGELMLHVANHGTHTRAQIAAAVRRLGKEPGVLEYLKFAMMFPAA